MASMEATHWVARRVTLLRLAVLQAATDMGPMAERSLGTPSQQCGRLVAKQMWLGVSLRITVVVMVIGFALSLPAATIWT